MRLICAVSTRVAAVLVATLLLSIGLAGCRVNGTVPTATMSAALTPQNTSSPAKETPTSTPPVPSPTPAEAVARVNGEVISLASFQAAIAQIGSLNGTPAPTPEMGKVGTLLATEEGKKALGDLVDQVLLAHGAFKAGFSLNDQAMQDHYNRLVAGLGSQQALNDWMARYGYTEESFRQDLARSIAAAWMRDQIASAVPQAAEQVHVRQILVYSASKADEALTKLNSGTDFAELAAAYDPLTRGDLGWFPRGYLSDPALETAAFSLEQGKYSEVIQTSTGYHILQVIERDPQRPLDPDARLKLQMQALQAWLTSERSLAKIEVLAP